MSRAVDAPTRPYLCSGVVLCASQQAVLLGPIWCEPGARSQCLTLTGDRLYSGQRDPSIAQMVARPCSTPAAHGGRASGSVASYQVASHGQTKMVAGGAYACGACRDGSDVCKNVQRRQCGPCVSY
ncbi:hypothetical protein psal_cds_577 [Pandoravirus salinus]|uniref:Uncharacterized protein n=1 Tax=Pandoravirus salinus TaxID=1349410 RepID=S4VV26_9VIRU|nr:hypothetical protein psal_cds_577 [Pandoravirus salinus]AGO84429.1 hypothetical protein psal_cds_577 [Pandoravirus salinus]